MKNKILITIGVALGIGGLIFALRHEEDFDYSVPNVDLITSDQIEQGAEQINKNDPECDGEKNKYYDIGYGVEHVYTGNITKDIPITMVLSCDHERLTISGSVSQVIEAKDIADNSMQSEVVDISGGSAVVYVEEDKNNDGYNDLEFVTLNVAYIYTYATFLYNPSQRQFVFSKIEEVDF